MPTLRDLQRAGFTTRQGRALLALGGGAASADPDTLELAEITAVDQPYLAGQDLVLVNWTGGSVSTGFGLGGPDQPLLALAPTEDGSGFYYPVGHGVYDVQISGQFRGAYEDAGKSLFIKATGVPVGAVTEQTLQTVAGVVDMCFAEFSLSYTNFAMTDDLHQVQLAVSTLGLSQDLIGHGWMQAVVLKR